MGEVCRGILTAWRVAVCSGRVLVLGFSGGILSERKPLGDALEMYVEVGVHRLC